MNKLNKIMITAVAAITIASVVTWQATGGDWYTKYKVVEQVETELDPNDPLVAAGFYEGSTTTTTESRDELRFGLLPTPAGLFDKHIFSVLSIVGPLWGITFVVVLYQRRRFRTIVK